MKIDGDLDDLRDTLAESRSILREKQAELATLLSAPSDARLREHILRLEEETSAGSRKLASLRSDTRRVDPAEKMATETKLTKHVRLWKERKRLGMDIVGSMCEGLGQKPKAMMEELGLELDPPGAK